MKSERTSRHILLTGQCMTRPVVIGLARLIYVVFYPNIVQHTPSSHQVHRVAAIYDLTCQCAPAIAFLALGCQITPADTNLLAVDILALWALLHQYLTLWLWVVSTVPATVAHDGTSKVHPAPLKVKRMTRDAQKYISTTSLLMKTHQDNGARDCGRRCIAGFPSYEQNHLAP